MADIVPLDMAGDVAPPLLHLWPSAPGIFCRPALSAVVVVDVSAGLWKSR
jgi:hypothetical protein